MTAYFEFLNLSLPSYPPILDFVFTFFFVVVSFIHVIIHPFIQSTSFYSLICGHFLFLHAIVLKKKFSRFGYISAETDFFPEIMK